jgi:hypothetical protein
MSQALSPSFARCYGLARVARVWKIARASVYRSLKETPPNTSARRPGPAGACSDAELADHIRQQIAASRLHGEGYRKLSARLRSMTSAIGHRQSREPVTFAVVDAIREVRPPFSPKDVVAEFAALLKSYRGRHRDWRPLSGRVAARAVPQA